MTLLLRSRTALAVALISLGVLACSQSAPPNPYRTVTGWMTPPAEPRSRLDEHGRRRTGRHVVDRRALRCERLPRQRRRRPDPARGCERRMARRVRCRRVRMAARHLRRRRRQHLGHGCARRRRPRPSSHQVRARRSRAHAARSLGSRRRRADALQRPDRRRRRAERRTCSSATGTSRCRTIAS